MGDTLFLGSSLIAGVGVRRMRTLHYRPSTQYHVHSAHRGIVGQCTQSPQTEAGLRTVRLNGKSASGGEARREPSDVSKFVESKSERRSRRFWRVICLGLGEAGMYFVDAALSPMKYLGRRNRWQEVLEQEMPWALPQGTPWPDSNRLHHPLPRTHGVPGGRAGEGEGSQSPWWLRCVMATAVKWFG